MRPAIWTLACAIGCQGASVGAMQTASEPAGAAVAAAASEPIPWPSPAASLVREVEVGPWELRWVGRIPLGAAPQEAADAEAVRAAVGADAEIEFEGEGSVIVRMPSGELSAGARTAGKPIGAYKHLSATAGEGGAVEIERTWFALYEPKAGAEDAGAMVVLLPGMFGTPEPVVDSLVGMLRSRGWHVLRMLTHPSRFTESAAFVLAPGGDLEGAAAEIAVEMGARAAACALAVEAVCEEIGRTREGVPADRRIALGMSGGGMVLTTVMAREPEAYAAAVFIGAGCDYAQVAMESNYTEWIDSVRIGWSGEPTVEERAAFTRAYRENAPFDSYTTAARVRGLPVLMLHGEADRAVPAALGDLLWERLGRPERWSIPLGHEALFLAYLPSRAADLLDWLDAHRRPIDEPE